MQKSCSTEKSDVKEKGGASNIFSNQQAMEKKYVSFSNDLQYLYSFHITSISAPLSDLF